MQCFYSGYMKKGNFLIKKWNIKRMRVWTSRRSIPVHKFVKYPLLPMGWGGGGGELQKSHNKLNQRKAPSLHDIHHVH